MDIVLLRELCQGPVAAQGRERHLGLERGCVIPSGAFHGLLSLSDGEFSHPVAEFSLKRLSYFPEPALGALSPRHKEFGRRCQ
jgi:hypothetical protein